MEKLFLKIIDNTKEKIELLIEKKANVNFSNCTEVTEVIRSDNALQVPIYYSLDTRQIDICLTLIEKKAKWLGCFLFG